MVETQPYTRLFSCITAVYHQKVYGCMVISHFPEKNLAVCVFCYLFRQISGDNAYYQRINYSLKKYCHESITFQAKKQAAYHRAYRVTGCGKVRKGLCLLVCRLPAAQGLHVQPPHGRRKY